MSDRPQGNYSDLNSWEFGGRIAFEPAERTTANGGTMVTTKIPVSARYNGTEDTTWVKVIAFGAAAEQVMSFRKGDKVKARGKVKLSTWTDKNNEKRTDLECMVWEMVYANEQFAPRQQRQQATEEPRREVGHQGRQEQPDGRGGGTVGGGHYDGPDEEIPFSTNAMPDMGRRML